MSPNLNYPKPVVSKVELSVITDQCQLSSDYPSPSCGVCTLEDSLDYPLDGFQARRDRYVPLQGELIDKRFEVAGNDAAAYKPPWLDPHRRCAKSGCDRPTWRATPVRRRDQPALNANVGNSWETGNQTFVPGPLLNCLPSQFETELKTLDRCVAADIVFRLRQRQRSRVIAEVNASRQVVTNVPRI